MATGSDLFTRMQRWIPELRNAAAGEQTRAYGHLTEAQEELVNEVNDLDEDILTKSATASTVADQKRYALPTDFDGMRYLEYVRDDDTDDTVRLDPIQRIHHKEDYDQGDDGVDWWWPTATLAAPTGQPRAYLRVGDFFELRPIPDDAYTLRMWYFPRLSAISSGSTVELPEALHMALVYKACIAERVYRHQKFDDLFALYQSALGSALRRLGDWSDDGPLTVNYTGYHDI